MPECAVCSAAAPSARPPLCAACRRRVDSGAWSLETTSTHYTVRGRDGLRTLATGPLYSGGELAVVHDLSRAVEVAGAEAARRIPSIRDPERLKELWQGAGALERSAVLIRLAIVATLHDLAPGSWDAKARATAEHLACSYTTVAEHLAVVRAFGADLSGLVEYPDMLWSHMRRAAQYTPGPRKALEIYGRLRASRADRYVSARDYDRALRPEEPLGRCPHIRTICVLTNESLDDDKSACVSCRCRA